MSVERIERDGGVVWRVRWREGGISAVDRIRAAREEMQRRWRQPTLFDIA